MSLPVSLRIVASTIALLNASATYSQVVTGPAKRSSVVQTIEDLKSDLDSLMNEIPVPGAAVAIVSRDSILWIGTFGFANVETGERVTENTHFCIGSCTKSFTGLAFLRLLDEGRIDLQTPVSEIAPEIVIDNPWEDTHPVRVIHLLEHTAGFDDAHPNWIYTEGPVLSLKHALEKKAHLRRVRWPPGTRFSYSSVGFTLAGYILEKASGQRYEEYLKQALLEPIGMTTSTIGSSEECRQRLAVGYDRNSKPFPVWYDYDEPAGAMNSSIREMALFIQFMLNRGAVDNTQIISADSFERIGKPTTTLAAQAGLKSGYSFGIGTSYRSGAKWYSHGGAVPGFLAEYAYCPNAELGYVVLQNLFDVWFYDDVLTHVRNYMNSHVDSTAPASLVSISKGQLEEYCGYYAPRSPRMQLAAFIDILTGGITVSYEHDTLYTQGFMDSKRPLIPVSGNLFRRTSHPEASSVFTRTSDDRTVYATRGSYYERAAGWKTNVYRILVWGALIMMLSSLVYSLFWVPVHIYKMLKRRDNRSKFISMRLIPLLAVLSLNMVFFVSTLLFAGLSTLSLYTTYRSFFKPVRTMARVYAVLLSSACFGMTLYLGYWGIIGLRLWAY
jgi:CubicO group peptidase (beta-lactamase class C family)